MAALTVQEIGESGIDPTFAAATAGGDTAKNDGRTYLHVKNADAGSHTATITAQRTTTEKAGFGTVTRGNIAVAVPAAEERIIGPFSEAFNLNGDVQITYDAVPSVTIAAFKLPLVR